MHRLKIISFCLVLLAGAPTLADSEPSRSECIIGYRLDWSRVTEDRRDVVNAIPQLHRTERMEALAATMFQAQHTELYLMFKSDCQKKEEMASWLIASWRKQDLNLPEFERIPDPIIPSTKTINVRGPHWRDEQPDGISPEKFRAEPDEQPI